MDLIWVEEPVRRWDADGMVTVGRGIRASIAAGENLTGLEQFRPLLAAGALDVVQTAAGWGVTHFLRVAALAHAYDLPVSPIGTTPMGLVHAATAVPNHMATELQDLEPPTGLSVDMTVEDGRFVLGDSPGLGVTVDEAAISRIEGRPSRAVPGRAAHQTRERGSPAGRRAAAMKPGFHAAGLPLPELGFGGAQIGNLYRATTDEEAAEAVAAAWDAGIRYFDTAPHYGLGLSERRLGRALRNYPRDDFVVSTKVGRLLEPSGTPMSRIPRGSPSLRPIAGSATTAVTACSARSRRASNAWVSIASTSCSSTIRTTMPARRSKPRHRPCPSCAPRESSGLWSRDEPVRDARPVRARDRRGRGDGGGQVHPAGPDGAQQDLLPAALDRGVGVINAGIFNSGLLSTAASAPGARFDYGTVAGGGRRSRHPTGSRLRAVRGGPTNRRGSVRACHPAVVSVVVGLRTPTQVHNLMVRWRRRVPEALWSALTEQGLLHAEVVG